MIELVVVVNTGKVNNSERSSKMPDKQDYCFFEKNDLNLS